MRDTLRYVCDTGSILDPRAGIRPRSEDTVPEPITVVHDHDPWGELGPKVVLCDPVEGLTQKLHTLRGLLLLDEHVHERPIRVTNAVPIV